MQTVRLTSRHREQITRALLAQRFEQEEKAIEAEQSQLALRAYHERFNQADRKRMIALPAGWMNETNHVSARFGSDDFHGYLPGKESVRGTAEIGLGYGSSAYVISLPWDHSLSKKHSEWKNRRRKLRADKAKAESDIKQVLSSVTTSARLAEVWPEIKKTVEAVCGAAAPSNLPAPRIEELNKMLGLIAA